MSDCPVRLPEIVELHPMGVTLYFSNRLTQLVDRLHQNLMPQAIDDDILQAPVVIVPNMNLSKWIKLNLSRKTSVFMNVEFAYLETGLWQMLRSLSDQTDPAPELLEKESLKILLFHILMAPDWDADALAPINRYLYLADGRACNNLETRSWQLCEELASLFIEYEYHRSDMIQRWLKDPQPADALESCQRWLYLKMLSLKEALGRSVGRPLFTIAEYADKIPYTDTPDRETSNPPPARVHFFGLSHISPLHLHILSRLRNRYDIHIYSLNPSREYWEDIKTPSEKKWIARKGVTRLQLSQDEWSAGDLFSSVDHALLSAWGKPGRENIRLLCQLTDYDFNAGFPETPRRDTVLAAVGHGLLTLDEYDASELSLSQDTSLQIVACPGIRREVETVHNSILYNLETDPDLNMTDIAVMVSDMSRYKPVVDSVFRREPERITYNLVDANARTESVFAQAVLALMALSRGSFSRKEVFDVLRNPCVMQRWDYGPEALTVWANWADELGIFHGYENEGNGGPDLPLAGLFSWRQGLERLRMSRFMTPPPPATGCPRAHFNGLVPFSDINTGDDRLLGNFCALVTALQVAVATLSMESASACAWRDAFFQVVDQFVEISDTMQGEKTVFQSLVNAFDHFLRYDALMQIAPGRPLAAEALWAFVSAHLDGTTGGRGDYLTGGVTVSALMPMRPIPFKIVYVLGLETGRFPGRSPESQLDLRVRKRRIGDVTTAERNRYLFLEILLSVQCKLYLSHVSRDLQKDQDLTPCSVVHQLQRYVEQQLLGGQPFKINHIPINADSPLYLAADAVNDWSDVMVNPSIAQRISCYRRSGVWEAFAAQVTTDERGWLARYDPDFVLPDRPPASEPSPETSLSIGLLRRFLLDPVTTFGRCHLGIAEQTDPTAELAEKEGEPLSSRFPIDYEMLTIPVKNWLVTQLSDSDRPLSIDLLATEFEARYADLTRKSLVPTGAFAVHDRSRLKEAVLTLGETLHPFVVQMRIARRLFSAVMIGVVEDEITETGDAQLNFNPLQFDFSDGHPGTLPGRVQLSGGLPWVWQAADDSWHCLVLTGSNRKPNFPDKYVIGPLLTLMAISACGEAHPLSTTGRITMHVVYGKHVLDLNYPLEPVQAKDYLSELIEEFYSPSPLLWLPFETIFGNGELVAFLKDDCADESQHQVFFEVMTESLKTAPDPMAELTGAMVTPHILDQARRRFGVFLPQS